MKLYLVTGIEVFVDDFGNETETSYLYGIFSTREKANEICKDLIQSGNAMNENIEVREWELDKPTDAYYWTIED